MPRNLLEKLCLVLGVAAVCACNRPPPTSPTDGSVSTTPTAAKDILEFPAHLRTEDEDINKFVETAMNACASGDYDRFRQSWSIRENPPSRGEFRQGWEAVQEIRILALKEVRIDPGADNDNSPSPAKDELHYVVLADVRFDPKHKATQSEPTREVVLLLSQEQGEWRIARAPKSLKEWIRQQVSTSATTGEP